MTLFYTLLRIAARNSVLNWRHGLAALLSIAAGFAAIVFFQGYIVDVTRMYDDTFTRRGMFGHVIVEREGARGRGFALGPDYDLKSDDQQIIDKLLAENSQVVNRTRFLNLSGTISQGATQVIFAGYGYDVLEGAATRGKSWAFNTVAGKPLDQAMKDGGEPMILGLGLARALGCTPDQKMRLLTGTGGYSHEFRPFTCVNTSLMISATTLDGRANAIYPTLVGLTDAAFKAIDDRFVALPIELAQSLLQTKGVTYYSVELRDPALASEFSRNLKAAAAASGIHLDATPWKEHRFGELYVKTMDFLSIFRAFILSVIVVIVILSVVNTMTKLVLERTREAAVLRCLGYSSAHVIALFSLEGTILGVTGSLAGALIAQILIPAINLLEIPYRAGVLSGAIPFRIAVVPELFLGTGFFLGAIAILSAVIPAIRVANAPLPKSLESHG